MSRSGRRARQMRLLAAGEWHPAPGRPPRPPQPLSERAARERTRALIRERNLWVAAVGTLGWERELTRRRGERNARLRQRRLTGYADARKAA